MKTINHKLKTDSGFTLVEVLVAIFLFSVAFTATTSILIFNARNATLISNNFVASGLVQEGMEVVRNIRDHDWFLDVPPGTQPFGSSIPDGTYRIQWNSQALIPLGGNPNLKKNAVTGLFSYDAGDDTIFKRTIDINTTSENPNNVEKRVIVNVTWLERGGAVKSISAESHLFNWR